MDLWGLSPPVLPWQFWVSFFPPRVLNGAGAKAADPISQALGLAALSLLSKQIVYRRGLYLKKELNVQSCFLALKRCRPAVASQRVGLCLARPRTGFDARLSRSARWHEGPSIVQKMCSFVCCHRWLSQQTWVQDSTSSTGARWGV